MEPASVTIKKKRALRLAFSVVVSLRPSRLDRYLGITAPMTQVSPLRLRDDVLSTLESLLSVGGSHDVHIVEATLAHLLGYTSGENTS